ncbi:MAG: cell surface protein SprA [Rhodothermaceae bacterium]|nr:cell surface protein SprA [Rhodothermaceae bacterium]
MPRTSFPVQDVGQRSLAPADTDSVVVDLSLNGALAADTTDSLAADTSRFNQFLPRFRGDRRTSSLFQRNTRPLSTRLGNFWRHQVEMDSTGNSYIAREQVGGSDVRYPLILDYDQYKLQRLEVGIKREFERLAEQSAQRRRNERNRGGLGFNIVVPGGRESAFSSIFGTTDIDLRVNGQANINAGFNILKSDQQAVLTGRSTQVDPEFRQDLRLGIVGSIGDKLKIDVNWDTERDFDYQNQLKLQYEGYDDDIIKSIEAGNVFLQTPSSLIRGGQSLFGIKSEFQVGGIQIQTVISQQEGQSNSLNIDGGSETVQFDLKPTDYAELQHFFLSYYFRNRWEEALSVPPLITVANGFERITRIEVWKLQPPSAETQDLRKVLGIVDLGESPLVRTEANAYVEALLPNRDRDIHDEAVVTKESLEGDGFDELDYQTGDFFKKLEEGRDYTFDEVLGYISMRSPIQDSEALAVAFEYIANGQRFQVGEFASEKPESDSRLILKLLRPTNMQQPNVANQFNPSAWYYEMRNIYPLKGRGLNANDFELQVQFRAPGQPSSKTLPGVGRNQTLLQILGLDRLNVDEATRPDDKFDYLVNYTIDPGNGLLIFPYLEPFGQRIADEIEATVPEGEKQAARDKFVFTNLYTRKRENARRDTQLDVYQIVGSYKGSVKDFYNLNAFAGVVEGSVRVTAGGTPLQEGTDYVVDYSGGTVSITNPAFLTAGRNIDIEYESNSLFNIQKKTLMGARVFYEYEDKLNVGTTVMRLSQKSPIDKFRLGEEPIANTIWGLDGTFKLEPRWLTRAVDAMPLIQTRAPSTITLSGEFAQLRPGHTETSAFRRSRSDLQDLGRDFNSDELKGISYVDDFEGFETTFSLKQAGAWQLTAPPDSISPLVEPDPSLPRSTRDSLRTNWRGTFAWYTLNINTLNQLGIPITPSTQIVRINDVFPTRDTDGEVDQTLSTLDMYFDPTERGPYNYNTQLSQFFSQPQDVWGGMVQRIPQGFNDFNLKNIEFVEFIMQPFPEGLPDTGQDAKLFVNLGFISEDVIPNGELNNEDGLSLASLGSPPDQWGRTPSVVPDTRINIQNDVTEDLGLDGLSSYDQVRYDPLATEQVLFADYLAALEADNTNTPQYEQALARIREDPSGDDYHYFGNDQYFLNTQFYAEAPSIQQRFSRYFTSTELNAFETQNKLATNTSVKRGNSQFPDSEDLNLNSTIDTGNNYFEYEVPLSRAVLDEQGQPDQLDDFIVGQVADREGNPTGWYQVRIPVQAFTRRVGEIQDFSKIESLRIWTTGHSVPVTIRFATLELVGSQWRKSEIVDSEILDETFPAVTTDTRFTISSVNNEEDNEIYRSPIGTVISQTRLATGGRQDAREQAMVLRAENLPPASQRAIFKTYPTPLDLLKYSNLRLFVHMHGEDSDGVDLATLEKNEARSRARLFVRFGANESNDYYEYEQPLSPSVFPIDDRDEIWQTQQLFNGEMVDLNSVNIELGAFNQLKVARDELGIPTDSLFWNFENGVLQGPNAEEFAPPGTRLAIKGTPSLGRVNTMVIGIRNPAPQGDDLGEGLGDITVWVNELRASGYDETNGWAALANVDIKFADLGRFKANVRRQTDGFGSLESSLGERDQNNINNWSMAGDLNLDKFLPERAGWSIPVSAQVQSNTSTPRFAPSRGDVRLEEIQQQIRDLDISEVEQEERIQNVTEAAQTFNFTRSYSFRVSKQNSRNGLMRVLVDGLSFNHSYTDSDARSPSQKLRDSWRWSSNLGYRLTVRQPKTVRPFWFLDPVPVIGLLGDLRLNYLPQSINASASAARNFSSTQQRSELRQTALEERARFPIREQHTFTHRRNMSVQYNPFQFLNLSFDTSTNQSLNQLGVDTVFTVIDLRDGFNTTYINQRLDSTFYATNSVGIVEDDEGVSVFQEERLEPLPAVDAFDGLFKNSDMLRTEQHDQRFNATFQPTFSRTGALNWITIQPVTYSVQYSWQNAAAGRLTGANVRNQVSVRSGVTLRPLDLWRKIPFYEKMEEQQRTAEQESQRKKREREVKRQEKRDAKKLAKEERKQQREEEAERRRQLEEERRLENERREAEGLPPLPDIDEELEEEAVEGILPDSVLVAPDSALVAPDSVLVDSAFVQPNPGLTDEEEGIGADSLAIPGGVQPGVEQEEEKKKPSFKLPLPKPLPLLRRLVLAATGVRDLSITYTGSRNSSSSNVGRAQFNSFNQLSAVDVNYSLIDSWFRNKGPSVAYRFGLERSLPITSRVVTPNLQVTDVLTDNNRIQAQTALNPSSTLTINLNWNVDWGTNQNLTYRPSDEIISEITENTIDISQTERGNNKASVWAFRADYVSLFANQLDTYIEDAGADVNTLTDANRDGRVVLTNDALVEDFLGTYLVGSRALDSRGLLPFPLPGWRVNFTGLSNWPVFELFAQNATLRHGYSADFSTDYRSNVFSAGADSTNTFNLGGKTVIYQVPDVETGTVRVNERFQPLVGLDLSFKNQIQMNMAWNKSNTYSLSTTSFSVNESRTSELSFSASYQKRGMKLPFFKKRLDNRVSFSFTLSRAIIDDQRYQLRLALEEAIAAVDDGLDYDINNSTLGNNVSVVTASTRFTLTPQISYQFSNRVSGDFRLRIENFDSEDSRIPSTQTTSGTFNIRVSIQN